MPNKSPYKSASVFGSNYQTVGGHRHLSVPSSFSTQSPPSLSIPSPLQHLSLFLSLMGDPPRAPAQNFYSILGIPKTATLTDICKAYKSLVMKWNPDKNPNNKSDAEVKIKSINEAYRVLSTKKREEYFNIDDQKSPENSFHNRKDDEVFPSSPSLLSRNASRRSHTPTPSPRNLPKSASRRSTTPPPSLSRSSSRSSTSSTREQPDSLSKITSRRSTTPIIFSQSTARRKPQPIEKMLECTLEELCNGCVKKIKITREVISNTGYIQIFPHH
ncbi:unnamed protein product [Ilex paraguariensis]|uniref:J domain-containing protein n=1 Tax=Ilex paraguariensis TaxID=185542 RepID=A0ABC8S2P5_9AQUA